VPSDRSPALLILRAGRRLTEDLPPLIAQAEKFGRDVGKTAATRGSTAIRSLPIELSGPWLVWQPAGFAGTESGKFVHQELTSAWRDLPRSAPVAPIGPQIRRNDRTLAKVPEYRRAVVAWSAGISAAAVAFAAIIAARATAALYRSPLFISCVVIAVVAGAILLVAGIPDLVGWLRRTEREEPAYWATVRVIRQRTGALNGQRQNVAGIAGFATGTEKYRWLAGEVWAGKTTLLAEAALQLRGNVDVIAYFASRREGDADSSRFLAAAVPQLAWVMEEAPPAPVREEFRALWRRVTERAVAKDRHVLLVVDGLMRTSTRPSCPASPQSCQPRLGLMHMFWSAAASAISCQRTFPRDTR
jgi:hypothetical protein